MRLTSEEVVAALVEGKDVRQAADQQRKVPGLTILSQSRGEVAVWVTAQRAFNLGETMS